jgi:type I restriction enzyme R subunit
MVKKRCAETIDNKDYENEMRNLLDKHMSVVGLRVLTKPIDIMDKGELEKEIEELGSKASKADAIRHNLSKNISINRDSNPAYYDSFSKRIEDVLRQYKDRVISDAEYLQAMKDILADFRANKSGVTYPEAVKQNVHAQAFYGVILPIINEVADFDINLIGEVALDIADIIERCTKVDWENNVNIHNEIAQEIDDLFWSYEKKGLKLPYEQVEKIIENVKTVAVKRF